FASVAGATTCSGWNPEPSETCTKETPAFESRRVRTQPRTVTGRSAGARPARMARTGRTLTSRTAAGRRGLGWPRRNCGRSGRRHVRRQHLLAHLAREEQRGVDARVVEAHRPVQVRGRDAAGASDRADDLAALDALALRHADVVEVVVHGDQALAVVEDDGAAVEVVAPGVDD